MFIVTANRQQNSEVYHRVCTRDRMDFDRNKSEYDSDFPSPPGSLRFCRRGEVGRLVIIRGCWLRARNSTGPFKCLQNSCCHWQPAGVARAPSRERALGPRAHNSTRGHTCAVGHRVSSHVGGAEGGLLGLCLRTRPRTARRRRPWPGRAAGPGPWLRARNSTGPFECPQKFLSSLAARRRP